MLNDLTLFPGFCILFYSFIYYNMTITMKLNLFIHTKCMLGKNINNPWITNRIPIQIQIVMSHGLLRLFCFLLNVPFHLPHIVSKIPMIWYIIHLLGILSNNDVLPIQHLEKYLFSKLSRLMMCWSMSTCQSSNWYDNDLISFNIL